MNTLNMPSFMLLIDKISISSHPFVCSGHVEIKHKSHSHWLLKEMPHINDEPHIPHLDIKKMLLACLHHKRRQLASQKSVCAFAPMGLLLWFPPKAEWLFHRQCVFAFINNPTAFFVTAKRRLLRTSTTSWECFLTSCPDEHR